MLTETIKDFCIFLQGTLWNDVNQWIYYFLQKQCCFSPPNLILQTFRKSLAFLMIFSWNSLTEQSSAMCFKILVCIESIHKILPKIYLYTYHNSLHIPLHKCRVMCIHPHIYMFKKDKKEKWLILWKNGSFVLQYNFVARSLLHFFSPRPKPACPKRHLRALLRKKIKADDSKVNSRSLLLPITTI